MATIVSENAKQIRDPMQVLISMRIESDVRITNITPGADYKSYDSTLLNASYRMRVLADLQADGFLLDGSAEWYEDKSPSSDNGKLGLRGTAGEPVSLTITGNKALGSLTIKTQGCERIEWESQSATATGLDYIFSSRTSTTITFYPDHEHGRVFVEYIEPGLTLEINNENLIRADLVLRSNLDPFATTLEESEINVEMYYPNDLGESFKYIGDDWPITYQAGYTNQKSDVRKFYLDGQVEWKNSVLSFRGVDAVRKLEVVVPEGDGALGNYSSPANNFLWKFDEIGLRNGVLKAIAKAGVTVRQHFSPMIGADGLTIKPEMTIRDYLQRLMSYTASMPVGNRFQYVDAGLPTFKNGETGTQTWSLEEEDIGDVTFTSVRNVSKIKTQGSQTLVEVTLNRGYKSIDPDPIETEKGSIFEVTAEGGLLYSSSIGTAGGASLVQWTPSAATYKALITGNVYYLYYLLIESGGVSEIDNPNGQAGEEVEIEPFIKGRFINAEGQDLFSPRNLFAGVKDKIAFTFKGDPRWQPRDFLTINRLDGTELKTRIGSIHIMHEGGGTKAEIEASYTDLY